MQVSQSAGRGQMAQGFTARGATSQNGLCSSRSGPQPAKSRRQREQLALHPMPSRYWRGMAHDADPRGIPFRLVIDGRLQRGVVMYLPKTPEVGETFEQQGGPTYVVEAAGLTPIGVPVLRLRRMAAA